jgi:predicted ATPase
VEVFAEILENCPQVKLLVTSRERLNLLSEWVFEIQGLPVPASDQVEKIEHFSSVALFLQSARRVRTGFAIREADRKWVLRICRVIEGMPLGICFFWETCGERIVMSGRVSLDGARRLSFRIAFPESQ